MKKLFLLILVVISGLLLPSTGLAQSAPAQADSLRKGALNLFLDCMSCDMNYTREEIPYVNYVRDTHEADVYLLVTSQNSGSGGNQFMFTFEGLEKFKGMHDTLIYTSNPDETSTIVREKKTNMMKMGLMRYVARTPLASEINITNNRSLQQAEVVDRWNNWVIELQTSPRFNAEESYKRFYISNSINISRVTEEFKLEVELDMSNNKQKFISDDIETDI